MNKLNINIILILLLYTSIAITSTKKEKLKADLPPCTSEGTNVIITYQLYFMNDFHKYTIVVHGISAKYYPFTPYLKWLRAGLEISSNFRITKEHTDWIFIGGGVIGFQYPIKRFVLFSEVTFSGGLFYKERYYQNIFKEIFQSTIKVGSDIALYYTIMSHFSLGYIYNRTEGSDFHSIILEFGFGW